MSYSILSLTTNYSESQNTQLNTVTLNGVIYSPGTAYTINQSTLPLILQWLNSLGFGAIFYGSIVTLQDSQTSVLSISTGSTDQFDSSLDNFIAFSTSQGEFSVNFEFAESTQAVSEILDNLACVMSNYENSFCQNCGCGDICKNKKSLNILKATLLMRELELPYDSAYEFQQKLQQYSTIIKTLCQCS
jgi:hypothetical protein